MNEEPTKDCIYYAAGYRYQLCRSAQTESGIVLGDPIIQEFYTISTSGTITVKRGFAWDGASGPAIDGPGTIYASMFHDILYKAMRDGLMDNKWRKAADKLYKRLCIHGGVGRLRAEAHYWALRFAGGEYNKLDKLKYHEQVAP